MPYKIKTRPELPILLQDPAVLAPPGYIQVVPFTARGLTPNTGRLSGVIDLGQAPRTNLFWWQAKTSDPAAGFGAKSISINLVQLDDTDVTSIGGYINSPGSPPSGDINFAPSVGGASPYLYNTKFVNNIYGGNTAPGKLVSSGTVRITSRYAYVGWVNLGVLPLSSGVTDHTFVLYPVPNEIQ